MSTITSTEHCADEVCALFSPLFSFIQGCRRALVITLFLLDKSLSWLGEKKPAASFKPRSYTPSIRIFRSNLLTTLSSPLPLRATPISCSTIASTPSFCSKFGEELSNSLQRTMGCCRELQYHRYHAHECHGARRGKEQWRRRDDVGHGRRNESE